MGDGHRGHLHLDWVSCRTRLSPRHCEDLIALAQTFPLRESTVVDQDALNSYRVGEVRFLPDVSETQTLYRFLWDVAADAAERHFGLEICGITRVPHFVEYRAGYGHFHWHNDYSHESDLSPRKLTVIVQLSDGDEYKGGDLEIFGARPRPTPRGRGSVICLPSFVPHRVTPVTTGRRRVIVAWIAGPRLV